MAECEVSVVSEIIKFEEKDLLLSNQNYEKQTVDEEVVSENSISIDSQTVDEEVMSEDSISIDNQTVDEEVSEDSISTDTQNEKQTVEEEVSEDSVSMEKQTADEKYSIITEEQTVDEEVNGNSDVNTQNKNEEEGIEDEGNVKLDWMKEFPPLQSRGIQVSSANANSDISTRNWVSALKKSHHPRPRPHPFDVNNLKTLKKEVEVGKNNACGKKGDQTLDQVEKFMKVWNENNKFHKGYVKDNAKSTVRRFGTLEQENRVKSVDEGLARKPKETRRQEVDFDFKQDATIEVEEKERKERSETSKAEVGGEVKAQMEAAKREKRRQKRLRWKERKKAARDGCSLDQIPELKHEKAQVEEADHPIKVQKDQDQDEQSSLEQEDELKEYVENKEDPEVRMLQQEEVEENETKDEDELKLHQENDDDQMLKKIQLNVQQQETEAKEAMMAEMRAELQAKLEAEIKEKRREKNLARKARKKKAKASRNKNMKWIILVITFILFTLSCLTIFYLLGI